jgi:hypothetical protein
MGRGLAFLATLVLLGMANAAFGAPASGCDGSSALISCRNSSGPQRHGSALRLAVLQRLRSPGTAKFRNEVLGIAADSGAYALCGWVNAEDQAGRLTGFVAFIATEDGLVLYQGSDAFGSFPHLWQVNCSPTRPHTEDEPLGGKRIATSTVRP